jgi:imidazolonepropionase-like amidohydrolase
MKFLVPGISLHDELALFVRAGFSPLEALQTATTNAAEYLGLTESDGAVVAGKRADFLLLDADPTVDIEYIRRIHAVVLGGQAITRKQLDAMLDDARERAKVPAPATLNQK